LVNPIGTKPEVLHDIHSHQINIAVYERDISHLQKDINLVFYNQLSLSAAAQLKRLEKISKVTFKN
jgi:hypothetical protein